MKRGFVITTSASPLKRQTIEADTSESYLANDLFGLLQYTIWALLIFGRRFCLVELSSTQHCFDKFLSLRLKPRAFPSLLVHP